MATEWVVEFADEFEPEFAGLPEPVRNEILAQAIKLKRLGPQLGRPSVDTLKGAKHANLKELRFDCDGGVWRLAFAFDPKRRAILLVAGNKAGVSKSKFYRTLIRTADERFDAHLTRVARAVAEAAKARAAEAKVRGRK